MLKELGELGKVVTLECTRDQAEAEAARRRECSRHGERRRSGVSSLMGKRGRRSGGVGRRGELPKKATPGSCLKREVVERHLPN